MSKNLISLTQQIVVLLTEELMLISVEYRKCKNRTVLLLLTVDHYRYALIKEILQKYHSVLADDDYYSGFFLNHTSWGALFWIGFIFILLHLQYN